MLFQPADDTIFLSIFQPGNFMKRKKIFFFIFIFAICGIGWIWWMNYPIQQRHIKSQRVACIIGNAAYQNDISPLKNTIHDAQDMQKIFSQLGFEVIFCQDATQEKMQTALQEMEAASPGKEVVFYYAGHGVQMAGRNYLLPINASVKSEEKLMASSIDTDTILQAIALAKMRVLIIDACRDNPFSGRGILVKQQGFREMQGTTGTVIIFATSPGQISSDTSPNQRNGLFIYALLQHIQSKNMDLTECMMRVTREMQTTSNGKQIPWVHFSLTDKFYFNPGQSTIHEIPPSVQQEMTYGLPPEIWNSCRYQYQYQWVLDMTSDTWKMLSLQDQAKYARAYQEGYAKAKNLPVEKVIPLADLPTDAQPMVMRLIPPGRFWMGSPSQETGHNILHQSKTPQELLSLVGSDLNEGPQHRVLISQAYYMAVYECTQSQWQAVMKNNPSYFPNAGLNAPVEQVSWNQIAKDQPNFLSLTNLRLPAESEWEYSCKAGTLGMSYAGDLSIAGQRNAPELSPIAWYGGNSGVTYQNGDDSSQWKEKEQDHTQAGTHPVGQKTPNAWGLHDTLGNVWEWCQDEPRSYSAQDENSPHGKTGKSYFANRGGSWYNHAIHIRAAYRDASSSDWKDKRIGFRPVLSADVK